MKGRHIAVEKRVAALVVAVFLGLAAGELFGYSVALGIVIAGLLACAWGLVLVRDGRWLGAQVRKRRGRSR